MQHDTSEKLSRAAQSRNRDKKGRFREGKVAPGASLATIHNDTSSRRQASNSDEYEWNYDSTFEHEILGSLPEGSGEAIFATADTGNHVDNPKMVGDGGYITSAGNRKGLLPPGGKRAESAQAILELMERVFSSEGWADGLRRAGQRYASSGHKAPDEAACDEMVRECIDSMIKKFNAGEEEACDGNATHWPPEHMPVATPSGHYWVPLGADMEDVLAPAAGEVYWSCGRLEEHEIRTDEATRVDGGWARKSRQGRVYSDKFDDQSVYLRMVSFDRYDETYGHMRGFSEVIVRYQMPDRETAHELIREGCRLA